MLFNRIDIDSTLHYTSLHTHTLNKTFETPERVRGNSTFNEQKVCNITYAMISDSWPKTPGTAPVLFVLFVKCRLELK